MCWNWIDSSRKREALTISCPGPGIPSLRRCTAGPGQKIAKTTPCKVERTPARSTPAALRPGARRKMRRRHGPNLISSRSRSAFAQTKRIKDSPFSVSVLQATSDDRVRQRYKFGCHAATSHSRGEPRSSTLRPLGVMIGQSSVIVASCSVTRPSTTNRFKIRRCAAGRRSAFNVSH
jgi:hypothetical protein